MDASALEGIPVDGFESFPEFLASMHGKIGINAAFYIGHCALRRYVMGDAAQEREATAEEVERMATIVRDAMDAGRRRVQLHPLADALRLGRPAGALAPRRASTS